MPDLVRHGTSVQQGQQLGKIIVRRVLVSHSSWEIPLDPGLPQAQGRQVSVHVVLRATSGTRGI